MSDELKPIELELMSLFDRDISAERRAILIEKLQDHPEMLAKYSAYLHLQDIELPADDAPPKYVRSKVLKAAYRRNRKLRWKERLSNLIRGLIGPAIAGPAVLCLAILVGYELMDNTTNIKGSEDLKSVGTALGDTASLEKRSKSEEALVASKTPKQSLGEPNDAVAADSTTTIDKMKLDLEPVKMPQKFGTSGSIAGNASAVRENKPKVRGGGTTTNRRSARTRKNRRKTRLQKVKSALSQSKSSPPEPKAREAFERSTIGVPKPGAENKYAIDDETSSLKPTADTKASSKSVAAATAIPEDSALPEDLLRGRSTNRGSFGTRDAKGQRSQKSARMRNSSEIAQRKKRRNGPAKWVDSDHETPDFKRQASKARNPRQLEMVANENADADEDTNIKPRTRRSSSASRVGATERRSFERFVRSLNRSESLDGVPSPILLEMSEIALKLEEYSRAQLWLRNVLGRQDEFEDKANLLFKKLRAIQNP